MGKFLDFLDDAAYVMYGVNTRAARQAKAARKAQRQQSGGSGAKFEGKEARVVRSGGTINVYYGGTRGNTKDDGHGHVKATGGPSGENIVFWRLPESEGGAIVVNNSWDTKYGNDLGQYLT